MIKKIKKKIHSEEIITESKCAILLDISVERPESENDPYVMLFLFRLNFFKLFFVCSHDK